MRIKVSYEVELEDVEHTTLDLHTYIKYCIGDVSVIPTSNPFLKNGSDIEPVNGSVHIERLK
jgi:hypothetical protein